MRKKFQQTMLSRLLKVVSCLVIVIVFLPVLLVKATEPEEHVLETAIAQLQEKPEKLTKQGIDEFLAGIEIKARQDVGTRNGAISRIYKSDVFSVLKFHGKMNVELEIVPNSPEQRVIITALPSEFRSLNIQMRSSGFCVTSNDNRGNRAVEIGLETTAISRIIKMTVYTNLEDLHISVSKSSKVQVSGLRLKGNVSLNGSSSGEISGNVECSDLNVNLSSSAEYSGNVECSDLNVNLSSSAEYSGDATCNRLRVNASSSADANLKVSNCKSADLSASSSGDVNITFLSSDSAGTAVVAKASSAGDINLSGNIGDQTCTSSSSGEVKIKKVKNNCN